MKAKKILVITFTLVSLLTLLSCFGITPSAQSTSSPFPVRETASLPTEFTSTPKSSTSTVMSTEPPIQDLEKGIFDKLLSGQYIVYLGINGLYGISPSNQVPITLVENTDIDSVAISPNGKYIAYWSSQRPNNRIFIDISSRQSKTFSINVECRFMTISPNGDLIACGGGEIYILSLNGGDTLQLTTWSESKPEDTWEFPVWSPDNNWVAYQNLGDFTPSNRDGLYLTKLSCLSKIEQCKEQTLGPLMNSLAITNGSASISWSPDSKFLVIPTPYAIHILDTSTKTSTLLTEKFGAASISWSPDGEWIAFTSFSDGNLYMLVPTSGDAIPLNTYGGVLGWVVIP